MKQITCEFCGDTYPDFDVAHVCSKGPYAPKLKSKMNERIDELIEQCRWQEIVVEDGVEYIHAHFLEHKFAESIVKECLMLVYERYQKAPTDDDGYFKSALDMVYDDIEQHFGIEK
jgi:hypothetical protein